MSWQALAVASETQLIEWGLLPLGPRLRVLAFQPRLARRDGELVHPFSLLRPSPAARGTAVVVRPQPHAARVGPERAISSYFGGGSELRPQPGRAKAAAKRAMAGGLRPAQVKAAVQKAAKGAPRKKTAPREGEGDPGNTAATSRQRSGPPLTGLFAGDGINGSRPNAGAGLDDGGGFGRVAGRTSPGGFGGGRGGAKEKKPDAKSGKFKSKSRYKRR